MCFFRLSRDDIVENVILHISKGFDTVSDFSVTLVVGATLMA